MKNFAHLKKDSPYCKLFPPAGWVPIRNILFPTPAECIGDGVQDVYMVDLDELAPEQFDAVARLVGEQCDPNFPLDLVKEEIRRVGLPLRAKHVDSVSSDVPFFL